MKIFYEQQNKTQELNFEGSMSKLLELLKINPEEVLTVKNDELVTPDEELVDSDEIKILSVISGG